MASLLIIRSLQATLFLHYLRTATVLCGPGARGSPMEYCVESITVVSIATEVMAVLARECSRCMKTARAISGLE
jgi:hypothetical protein